MEKRQRNKAVTNLTLWRDNCVRDKGTKSIKPAELFYKTESLLCGKRFVPMQYPPRLTIGVEIRRRIRYRLQRVDVENKCSVKQ